MLARTPRSVPYLAKPPPAGLSKELSQRLRDVVVDILRSGRPTLFCYEAASRHGLRIALIVGGGLNWALADAEASRIVRNALAVVGARRPTWQQGQPEFVQWGYTLGERTRCIRCARPLPEGAFKFCGRICRETTHTETWRRNHLAETQAARRTFEATWSARQAERPCAGCGGLFKPKSRKSAGLYCSLQCYRKHLGGRSKG